MRKLIHSNFELDLTSFQITETEENNWFSDTFFTKYSFPFEIDVVKDLEIAFGFITLYNTNPETYFNVKYVHDNIIEDAVFEIESYQTKLSCTLKFGYDQLPNFDKKLSELPLDDFNLPTGISIYDHANTIVSQTWPDVNYNFPQIHTEKYDTTQYPWAFFGKIINNRVDGLFLLNEYNVAQDYEENRNIIQPLPYLLYLLKKGFENVNLTLAGDIITDALVKKITIFATLDYFEETKLPDYNELIINNSDGFNIRDANGYGGQKKMIQHFGQINIGQALYNITGTIKIKHLQNEITYVKIYHNGTIIYNKEFNSPNTGGLVGNYNETININVVGSVGSIIELHSVQVYSDNGVILNYEVCNLEFTPLTLVDNLGNPITSIKNKNAINLKKAVPDITFGNLVSFVKNYMNYDLSIIGNQAVMNKVESQINHNDSIDLQFAEIKFPMRKFHTGNSYLLKFADVTYPAKPYLPVFQNQNGFVTSGFVTDDKTSTIEVNALPLPLLKLNNIETAFAFEDDAAKIYLVIYDGLTNGKNLSKPIDDYLIPAIHLSYWKRWFEFRIKSGYFLWNFKSWVERIKDLKAKTKIYAFGNTHLIKTINKTQIKEDLYDIELETETIK